jgi:hypothetical protein
VLLAILKDVVPLDASVVDILAASRHQRHPRRPRRADRRLGPWTGSSNQRIIDLAVTRERGAVVPWRCPRRGV